MSKPNLKSFETIGITDGADARLPLLSLSSDIIDKMDLNNDEDEQQLLNTILENVPHLKDSPLSFVVYPCDCDNCEFGFDTTHAVLVPQDD